MKKLLLPRFIEMLDLVRRGAQIPNVNATWVLLENPCGFIIVEPDVKRSRPEDREAHVQQRGSTIYVLRVKAGTWQHHLCNQIGPCGVRKSRFQEFLAVAAQNVLAAATQTLPNFCS